MHTELNALLRRLGLREPYGIASDNLAALRAELTLLLEGSPGISVDEIGVLIPRHTTVRDLVMASLLLLSIFLWPIAGACSVALFWVGAFWALLPLAGFGAGIDGLGRQVSETQVLAGPDDAQTSDDPILLVAAMDSPSAHISCRRGGSQQDQRFRVAAATALVLSALLFLTLGSSVPIRYLIGAATLAGLALLLADRLRFGYFPAERRLVWAVAAAAAMPALWSDAGARPVFIGLTVGGDAGQAGLRAVLRRWQERFGQAGTVVVIGAAPQTTSWFDPLGFPCRLVARLGMKARGWMPAKPKASTAAFDYAIDVQDALVADVRDMMNV